MKKILILGAGHYQLPLIKKAIEIGLYTIVVSPAGDYPGLDIADKTYDYDIRDIANILRIAIKEKIEGVVTDQTDIPVRTAAYIAEKLNLPGIGYEVSKIFTDKFLMKEKCRMAGIDIKKYAVADDVREAIKFCSKINFPVVIKPLNNQGSRGVYKIFNNNDLSRYFQIAQNYSSSKNVLIEEFIDGHEFIVDSLCLNHKYNNLLIGDTYFFNFKNRFIPNMRFFPSIFDKHIKERIIELDKKIIELFGLKDGITFAEYIIEEKTGKIYLIEIGARGQAVYISSDLISLFTGIDVNEFLLNFGLGNKIQLSVKNDESITGGYIAFYLPSGKIISLDGINEVCRIKDVLNHDLYSIKKNQTVDSIKDKSARKSILIKSKNRAGLILLREKIKSLLKIKIETSDGVRGIIWD